MKKVRQIIALIFVLSTNCLFAQIKPITDSSEKIYIQSIIRAEIERKDSIKQVLDQLSIKVNNTEKELSYANQKVNDYHELFKDQWSYFGIMLSFLAVVLAGFGFVSFRAVITKIKELDKLRLDLNDIGANKIPEINRLISLLSGVVSYSKFAKDEDRNVRVETIAIELRASYNAYRHSKRPDEIEKLIRSIKLVQVVANLLNAQALYDVFKHNNTDFEYKFDESKFGVPDIIEVLGTIILNEPNNLKSLANEKLDILTKEIKNLKGENGLIEGRIN